MSDIAIRWYDDDGYHYKTCKPSDLLDECEVVTENVLGNLLDVMHDRGLLSNDDLTEVFGHVYEVVDDNE